jgi:hypothetical protein
MKFQEFVLRCEDQMRRPFGECQARQSFGYGGEMSAMPTEEPFDIVTPRAKTASQARQGSRRGFISGHE